MTLKKSIILISIILLIDQVSKIYIKTHFILGESVPVFDWFKIYFIENEGMAWGAKIPLPHGKLILTLFRLVVVPGIGYWLWDSIKKNRSPYLITAIALIFAGALGNIIDSVFYGVVFNDSTWELARLFSDKPYGTLLHGKVVDMLYFPFFESNFPIWLPVIGGDRFSFFNAVFNVADMAISTGVGILLVFNKKAFGEEK